MFATTARTVKYSQLMSILKSKDESLFADNSWIWEGKFKFFDQSEHLGIQGKRNTIQLTSFPRSGNSFLRRTTEKLTGIASGSVMPMAPFNMAMPLQLVGYNGEGHTDDRVFCVKAHHPLELGFKTYNATKTVVCIRNPLDVFPSYAALSNTNSHDNRPDFEIHSEYPEWWTWFVKLQTGLMKRFFTTILKDCQENKQNPLYIIRYEDMVLKQEEALTGLFSFILEQKDLTGTNAERRIA